MENQIKDLIDRLRAKNKLDKYKICKTDQERIKLTLQIMLEDNFVLKETSISKDERQFDEVQTKSKKLYKTAKDNKTLIEVLKLCTTSIAFAPYSSVKLALAYANRSIVLFQLNLYSECIEDIERALALNYPNYLKTEIYVRKAKCLAALRKHPETKNTLKKAQNWLKKVSDFKQRNDLTKTLKLMLEMLPAHENLSAQIEQFVTDDSMKVKKSENALSNISSFNAEVPYASDAVAIKYNEDYGRHLIATRDIQPGEVIAVEKPYTLLLNQDEIYTHCSNCLKVCWASIPCKRCIYAMYCSEKCRDDQWKKCHNVECDVISALIKNDCNDYDLLSLRLAVLALNEFKGDMEKLKSMVKRLDDCNDLRTNNFSQDGKLHSDKYAGIYNLSTFTYTGKVDFNTLRSLFFVPCIIIYFLATRTKIFGTKTSDLSSLVKNKYFSNVIFFGDLISRHQRIISMNSYDFYEACGKDYYACGKALTSFCSLINHSCNPNVLVQSRLEHLVMLAIYPIQKHEQLFLSYAPIFYDDLKHERQEELKIQYSFECNCVACQEEWPLLSELQSYKVLIKEAEDKAKIEKTLQNFVTYNNLICDGNVDDKPYLLGKLLKMVRVLHKYAPLPCKETTLAFKLLRCAYMITGNRSKLPQKQEIENNDI